ncbi:hypothetical protein AAG607_13710 [Citromicrobium bathyomarinum]|uniref:lysozyme n=1 Tax=Citromicrobium bathyomarinum TaxID=72174 RepID=UPI00315B2EC4
MARHLLLSERTLLEIIEHEAIVREAYKDSKGIWTWGVGVTNDSGHDVFPRYHRKPATLEKVLAVFEWLLRTKYLPEVRRAFEGVTLSEAQLAGALSFHWNTGSIGEAFWVKSFLAGNLDAAYREFMNWSTPQEIIGRRRLERALFFKGTWTSDGFVTLIERVHRNGNPDWSSRRQIDIRPQLRAAFARSEIAA